jgi:hypothetical protein
VNEPPYEKSANEPHVHPLVAKSFVFLPSTGMRLAPEILVLELLREVFFDSHFGSAQTKPLDPMEVDGSSTPVFSVSERAVVSALRGRRKAFHQSNAKPFYAPAYPSLARTAWLGARRERVIKNFLFSGAIAQHLWHKGRDVHEKVTERDALVELILTSLRGARSHDRGAREREILSVAVREVPFTVDVELARRKLRELVDAAQECSVYRASTPDELAARIVVDLRSVCELDARLPRMQWLRVMMTFLRFSLSMWVLAQMRLTTLLHGWLLDALDGKPLPTDAEILGRIGSRNRDLLHPTLTPTREIHEHIERYMRHRVELNVLLYALERAAPGLLGERLLSTTTREARAMTISDLLALARGAADKLRKSQRFLEVAKGLDARRFAAREGENYGAWRTPRQKGQGKNIDEFLRVLYRAEIGDETGGFLLVPEGRGVGRGFRVFPGQELLKTVTFLAAHDKRTCASREGRGGALVLSDLERHFREYGIDFSMAADARPRVVAQLQSLGLLAGSPDAGSSVALECPY